MAEAAGAYVAYEAVETVVEIGVGAYFIAKPTVPLKATLIQISPSSDDGTKLSLARSGHSLSVVGSKAYIFGGLTASNELASNDMHAVGVEPRQDLSPAEYSVSPAVSKNDDKKVPVARTRHAACAFKEGVAIFGGVDDTGQVIDEHSAIWLYNTQYQNWELLDALNKDTHAPKPRSNASLFEYKDNIILYGGHGTEGEALRDVWCFDNNMKLWSLLPGAPVSTRSATLADGVLHLISEASGDGVSNDLHFLPITLDSKEDERKWHTVPFPTNPLTPGPAARVAAGLLPVSTGYGRMYLLYLFGSQPDAAADAKTGSSQAAIDASLPFFTDMWTYQLPSSRPEMKPTTNMYEAMKPAKIKDAIRDAIPGVGSGKHSWWEVELQAPGDFVAGTGKIHPGPRNSFACDVMKDRHSVVLWGGINPKGDTEGDGWVIRLE